MKIIGSDFDGTLNHGGMTEAKLKAIEKWRNAGNKFGIISGRGKDFRVSLLSQYPELKIDFFASCSGAYTTDQNGEIIYEARCCDVSLSELTNDLFDWGCKCVHVNASKYACIVKTLEDKPSWVNEKYAYLSENIPDVAYINQVSVQLPSADDSAEVVEKVRNKYSKYLNPLQNGVCIDIVPAGVNKAEGIYRIMEYFGCTYDDVITVGDNINDMDMIKEFRSYAMKNGVAEVKNAANGIVSDVTEIFEIEM